MRPLGREIPGRSPGTAQGVERRRRHDRMPALLHASLKKKIKKNEYKAQAEITEAQWSYGRVRKSERVLIGLATGRADAMSLTLS